MNKKLKLTLISAIAAMGLMLQVSAARASEVSVEELLQTALSQKTFYSFNMAYDAILKIEDGNVKRAMLTKLDALTAVVWTEDIKKFNLALEKLVQTASGRLYDQIVAEVANSKLNEMDKGYLLGELTGWGKRLVYTPDYTAAVDSVVSAWTNTDEDTLRDAEDLISKVVNSYSREYLTEELQNVKAKHQNDVDAVLYKVNYLLEKNDWSRDEKLSKLQLTFAKTDLIKIPEDYMYTVGGYHILDRIQTFRDLHGKLYDIEVLRREVNMGIAYAEASKFNDGNLVSYSLTFEQNKSGSKIDVTDKILKTNGPMIEGTTYEVKSVLFWDSYEPLDPARKAFEIIDGRVYLKPEATYDVARDDLAVTVKYKDGTANFIVRLEIGTPQPRQPEIQW